MPPLKWGTHDEGPWSSQCKCALSNQARDAKVFGQVRPLGRMFWDLRFGSSRGNVRSFRDPASFFGGGTDLLGSKKTAFNLSSSSAGTNVQGYEVLGVQGWSSFRRWIPERGGVFYSEMHKKCETWIWLMVGRIFFLHVAWAHEALDVWRMFFCFFGRMRFGSRVEAGSVSAGGT